MSESTIEVTLGTSARFAEGFFSLFRAFGFLLSHPRSIPLVLVPFALTVVVFVAFTVASFLFVDDLQAWLWPDSSPWWGWIAVTLILLGSWVFTFTAIGSVIAAPFSERLSQMAEAAELGSIEAPPGGLKGLLEDSGRAIAHELVRIAIYALILLVTLPLLLVPFVGAPAFAAIGTYVTLRYLAWDGFAYSFDRRRMGFREKWGYLGENRARTLGYGIGAFLMLAIPLTTLFVLPMNALGGTLLYCRIERERRGPASSSAG